MSTVSESNPWWAITSAANELGMDSQPFTTASPLAQIFLTVFSRTGSSFDRQLTTAAPSPELGATYDPKVAPFADSEVLGLLEVGDRRDVRRRIDHVRLHRADREAQLLLDGLEPLLVPGQLRHLGLAQVRLEEIDLRRRHAQHLVGVERVAAELERGAVRGRAARLPVDEREPAVIGPEAEVGRHPHRRALEVEHLGPVLDRPVLARRLAA